MNITIYSYPVILLLLWTYIHTCVSLAFTAFFCYVPCVIVFKGTFPLSASFFLGGCMHCYIFIEMTVCINFILFELCAIVLQKKITWCCINLYQSTVLFSIRFSHRVQKWDLSPFFLNKLFPTFKVAKHLWVYCLLAVHATLKLT